MSRAAFICVSICTFVPVALVASKARKSQMQHLHDITRSLSAGSARGEERGVTVERVHVAEFRLPDAHNDDRERH